MALKGSSYLKAAGVQELYAQMRDTPDLNLKDRTFAYVFRAVASCGGGFPAYWIIQVHIASVLYLTDCAYIIVYDLKHVKYVCVNTHAVQYLCLRC